MVIGSATIRVGTGNENRHYMLEVTSHDQRSRQQCYFSILEIGMHQEI